MGERARNLFPLQEPVEKSKGRRQMGLARALQVAAKSWRRGGRSDNCAGANGDGQCFVYAEESGDRERQHKDHEQCDGVYDDD